MTETKGWQWRLSKHLKEFTLDGNSVCVIDMMKLFVDLSILRTWQSAMSSRRQQRLLNHVIVCLIGQRAHKNPFKIESERYFLSDDGLERD